MSSAAAQSAIADASSRHAEILRLEQSVSELNEMYNDIAFLVHSQVVTELITHSSFFSNRLFRFKGNSYLV